jgi:hypothetical protein
MARVDGSWEYLKRYLLMVMTAHTLLTVGSRVIIVAIIIIVSQWGRVIASLLLAGPRMMERTGSGVIS